MKNALFVVLACFAMVNAQPQPKPRTPVAPAAQPTVAAPAPAPYTGPVKDSLYPIERIPVSDTIKIPVLDFKNADIRDVLRGLGMQYGLNIFTEPEVQGPITLYLTNVTVRSAIDFLVKRSGNAYAVEGGIVKVYKYKAPAPPPPPKPAVTFHLANGLLSVDIKKVPVQEVARMFADSASLNVMIDGAGEGEISTRIVGIKAEKAVRAIFVRAPVWKCGNLAGLKMYCKKFTKGISPAAAMTGFPVNHSSI